MDIAAAIAAGRHSGRTCVTASVDELHFLRPIRKGFIVNIEAVITAVQNTSCEVRVTVGAENMITGERFHTARAFMTFVALDDTGRPVEMPPLGAETPEEKKHMKEAKVRAEHRRKLKNALGKVKLEA